MKAEYTTYIVIFFIISLFSAGNYYVFSRLNIWLSIGLGWKFNLLGALLGFCSFILILFHFHSFKFVYFIASCWFGIMFIAFNICIVGDIVARILPIKQSYIAYFAISIVFFLSVYSVVNNLSDRKVESIHLQSPKIETPIRIVLIADTHISGYSDAKYLQRLVREINSQNPDIVTIVGDFADGKTDYSAIEPINDIKAPVYLVMGNHEIWNNHNGAIEKKLSKTKIAIAHKRKFSNKGVQIIGVNFADGQNTLKEGLEDIEIDKGQYNVLIYHEPKEVEIAQETGFDLMLSGHTHGGQIFPWNYVTKLAYKYIKGLYEYEGMKIYVSQGTGIWGPPMRLGSENEITVIDLKPDKTHEKRK